MADPAAPQITAVPARLELIAVPEFPLVAPGDDLAAMAAERLDRAGLAPRAGDVLVFAQKVVSKAEGRQVDLAGVLPSSEADALAVTTGKDPRLVELVLRESRRVVRTGPGVLIVEHRLGFVMANAGIDQSNVAAPGGALALLLPEDPDASARALAAALSARAGGPVGVVISDSFGRPWRLGTTGVAIGAAGLPALLDRRGRPDLFGRPLRVTMIGHADEIAAAASLLMGQADEGQPVILVRGLSAAGDGRAADLVRPAAEDLFR